MASAGTVTLNLDANSVKLLRELQRSQNATRRTASRMRADFNRVAISAAKMGAAFAAATAVIVKSQASQIDALAKTADALGVTTENLQALQQVAKLTGASTSQLEKAMERMQRSLGEAARRGGNTAQALADIGLSINDVLGMSADQQLEVLSKALANVGDAAVRASIENDLFGRGALQMRKMMNQLANEGLDPVRSEIEALGGAISRTQAAGVERMNDAMLRSGVVAQALAQQFTVGISPAIAAIAEQFIGAAKESNAFASASLNAGESVGKALAFVVDAVVGVQRVFEVWGRSIAVAFASMELGALQFANSIINGPGAALDFLIRQANRIPGVDVDFQFGPAVPQIQERMDRAAAIVREGVADIHDVLMQEMPSTGIEARLAAIREDFEQTMAGGTAGLGAPLDIDITPAQQKLAEIQRQVAEFGLDDVERQISQLSSIDGFSPAMLEDARQMLEYLRDAGVTADAFAEKQREAASLFDATRTPLERFNAEIERLNELRDTFVDGAPLIDPETYRRGVEAAQDALDAAQNTLDVMGTFADQAARNMQDAFAQFLFDPFEDGLSGMLRGFLDTMRRMVAEIASQQILQSLFGGFAGSGGFLGALGGAFGGARADGGPVSSGKTFLVGERGPELFTPSTSGQIIPNHAMGGNVTVNIDARQSDDPARLLALAPVIATQVEQSISLKMRRGYL